MTKKPNRLANELLETAEDMHGVGLLDRATFEKITMRHLGQKNMPRVSPITAEQIRAIRERANMSQAVFARYLNLTVGYVSQLERGAKARHLRCSTSSDAKVSRRFCELA
jgi:putative transcriptional regulator